MLRARQIKGCETGEKCGNAIRIKVRKRDAQLRGTCGHVIWIEHGAGEAEYACISHHQRGQIGAAHGERVLHICKVPAQSHQAPALGLKGRHVGGDGCAADEDLIAF